MKPERENDVIQFQSWLDQSIRRAWILAFAVAVPGAFLLTLWFPHSPEALVGLAILGIAVGIISEAVERAKKRRLEEMAQFIDAMRQTLGEITATINARLDERTSELARTPPSPQPAEKGDMTEHPIITTPTQGEAISKLRKLWGLVEESPGREHPFGPVLFHEAKPLHMGGQHVLAVPFDTPMLIPGSEIREVRTKSVFELASITGTEVELFKEITARINLAAREMDIPPAGFWRYLELIASVRRSVSESATESKQVR